MAKIAVFIQSHSERVDMARILYNSIAVDRGRPPLVSMDVPEGDGIIRNFPQWSMFNCPPLGPWRHFLRIVRRCERFTDFDAILILQDDIEFTPGLFPWLSDVFEWPEDPARIGCVSLYMDAQTAGEVTGNYQWIRRAYLPSEVEYANAGACALLLPMSTIRALSMAGIEHWHTRKIGTQLLRYFSATNLSWWYHNPSLIQHIGKRSLVDAGGLLPSCRRSAPIPESMEGFSCGQGNFGESDRGYYQRIGLGSC